MFATHEAAQSVNSALILSVIGASIVVLYWRTALRIVITIAAITMTVLIISGAVVLLNYAHALR